MQASGLGRALSPASPARWENRNREWQVGKERDTGWGLMSGPEVEGGTGNSPGSWETSRKCPGDRGQQSQSPGLLLSDSHTVSRLAILSLVSSASVSSSAP